MKIIKSKQTNKQKKHNFACDNVIYPKQGQTRASSGPITVPLKYVVFAISHDIMNTLWAVQN